MLKAYALFDVQVQLDLQTSAGVALRFGPSSLDTATFSMLAQGDRTVLCLNISPLVSSPLPGRS